jgi:hypothetical protein
MNDKAGIFIEKLRGNSQSNFMSQGKICRRKFWTNKILSRKRVGENIKHHLVKCSNCKFKN